jgi:23S rRNA (cytidine1920-2'-O)/16S rRNA (cytidine1409-2'-O)-methyltransferase
MSENKKLRLDVLVQEKLPDLSRTQVAALIAQGKISVGGRVIVKPGVKVLEDAELQLDCEKPKYVGRAGFKLEHILQELEIDVSGLVVLDAGLSIGGFTDCLLQNGAIKVYGVDVGSKQAHAKIKADDRVEVMEQVNLRHLETLPQQVDLITLDLSFISVLKIIPNATKFLKQGGKLIVLIKPQFEVGKGLVGSGGIVRDEKLHQKVVADVVAGIEQMGFVFKDKVPSPITGGDGNQEFLAYFIKN